VLTSAGTYSDISPYLQLLPCIVASSDFSNQMLVRSGHPMGNLFLVDDFEVPNINHLANSHTTGGENFSVGTMERLNTHSRFLAARR
jgi:hypothetical protein